jgi:hypothetical protein
MILEKNNCAITYIYDGPYRIVTTVPLGSNITVRNIKINIDDLYKGTNSPDSMDKKPSEQAPSQ